ncbi:hypothetical protein ABT272_41360 [Streptomyces sp900105245]|uniref:Uncharacterized protein n=1 Tax=Streptomyces sp. 900105245 TaxID=3154379 RepID=A0ABV1UK15_9ACTN
MNGSKSGSSSVALISATEWTIGDEARAWLQHHGHLERLGEHALQAADEKWRAYRAAWAPRTAAAWDADWRAWIARERTPAPGRPNLYALPGGTPTPPSGMTRAEAHTAAPTRRPRRTDWNGVTRFRTDAKSPQSSPTSAASTPAQPTAARPKPVS